GHRTRLAQERPDRWHDEEDRALDEYVRRSQSIDALALLFTSALPRGWTALAIAVLGGAFVTGSASSSSLAVSVGGILVASLALRHAGAGLIGLVTAAVAWRQARLLFEAASGDARSGHADSDALGRPSAEQAAIDARDIVFRYANRPEPVLRGCSVRAAAGD